MGDWVEPVRRANGKGPRHDLAHSMLIYPKAVGRFNSSDLAPTRYNMRRRQARILRGFG